MADEGGAASGAAGKALTETGGRDVQLDPRHAAPFADWQAPGAALPELPADEHWSTVSWSFLRRKVLQELRSREPCTLGELLDKRPKVFDLELDADEIAVLLDSARRSGLIEMVSDGRWLDGRVIAPEWILTEKGRRTAPQLTTWALDLAASAGRRLTVTLSFLIGVVALFGITFHVGKLTDLLHLTRNADFTSTYNLVASTLLVAFMLALLRQSRVLEGPRVRAEWSRYARKDPRWRDSPLGAFPWGWAILGCAAYLAGDALLVEKATRLIVPPTGSTVTGLILTAIGCLVAWKALRWVWRFASLSDSTKTRP